MSTPGELTGREINAMLAPHAEALVWLIFPNARKDGAYLCVGSVEGEPGKSLKIKVRGHNAGGWADFSLPKSDPRGTGDLLKLIQLTVAGGSMAEAFKWARGYLNLDTMDPKALERQRERAARAAERAARDKAEGDAQAAADAAGLWLSASPLTPSSPPVLYLAGRGIDLQQLGRMPGAIRFHHAVWHDHLKRKLPAMLTKFQTLAGRHAATHVTYLDRNVRGWTKLGNYALPEGETKRRQKIIRGPAYALGAHIALWKGDRAGPLGTLPQGSTVEVSEGIEDGLSYAMANRHARVIAAGTLGIIGQVQLPPTVTALNVLAQNDTHEAPIASLEQAIRLQQERAVVANVARTVAVRRPPAGFKDWNDWLRGVEA